MINRKLTIFLTVLLFIIFISGVYAHCTPRYLPFSLNISEILLFGTNLLALVLFFYTSYHAQTILWSGILLIGTFGIEAYGVASGNIFGQYNYGDVFSVQILNVPVLIALNWLVLTLAAANIGKQVFNNNIYAALLAGILVLIFDIIMEPVAISLNYWRWEATSIPIQNYLTWFIIGSVGAYLFITKGKMKSCLILRMYFFAQLIFFIGINFCIR